MWQDSHMTLPRLPEPTVLANLRPYLNDLVDALEGATVHVYNDEGDFFAQNPNPGDFMLVGLRNTGSLNIYSQGRLNQVWPALPAFEYGPEAPTHAAPNGTIFVQVV